MNNEDQRFKHVNHRYFYVNIFHDPREKLTILVWKSGSKKGNKRSLTTFLCVGECLFYTTIVATLHGLHCAHYDFLLFIFSPREMSDYLFIVVATVIEELCFFGQ
jgi:hypothetical protein